MQTTLLLLPKFYCNPMTLITALSYLTSIDGKLWTYNIVSYLSYRQEGNVKVMSIINAREHARPSKKNVPVDPVDVSISSGGISYNT